MCIALDEFTDREAIRCFFGGDADVFSHNLVSLIYVVYSVRQRSCEDSPRFKKCLRFRIGIFTAAPKYLNIPQGACGSSVYCDHHASSPICEAIRRARWRSVPRTAAWRHT